MGVYGFSGTYDPGEPYKYTRYVEDGAEELYDLVNDPMERNPVNPVCRFSLQEMRKLLWDHERVTKDPFETLPWKADKRWRSHPAGYQNHHGIAAPMAEEET
ncbi:MAG: hypothetical protein ACLT46_05995 [Hungatella sp.]